MDVRKIVAGMTVLAAGCLPERDNIHDPANRPQVVLDVGAVRASPSSVLRLSVEETSPLDAPLIVQWSERATDAADWTPIATADRNPVFFAFEDHLPHGWVGLSARQVRAVVSIPGKGSSEASAIVEVVNAAPRVIAKSFVEVPPGGRPWSGEPWMVQLDAAATDDDPDDVARVRWELLDGVLATWTTSGESAIVVEAPFGPGATRFLVTASDGSGATASEIVTFAVSPLLWVGDRAGPLRRIADPPFTATLPVAEAWPVAVTQEGTSHFTWTLSKADNSLRWLDAESGDSGEILLGLAAGAVEDFRGGAPAADGDVWVAFSGSSNWLRRYSRLGGAPEVDVTAYLARPASNTAMQAIVPDPQTDGVWILRGPSGSAELVRLSSSGADAVVIADPVDPAAEAYAIDSDGAGGVWVLETSSATLGPGRLHHYAADGTPLEVRALPAELPFPRGFRYDALRGRFAVFGGATFSGSVWAALLDADLTVLHRVDDSITIEDVELDARDGGLWVLFNYSGVLRKYAADGTVLQSETAVPNTVEHRRQFVLDDRGFAWLVEIVATGTARLQGYSPQAATGSTIASVDLLKADEIVIRAGWSDLVTRCQADGRVTVVDSLGDTVREWRLTATTEGGGLGAPAGPSAIAVDGADGTIWFASHIVPAGDSVLFREGTAVPHGVPSIRAMAVDPVSGDLCIGGGTKDRYDIASEAVVERRTRDGDLVWRQQFAMAGGSAFDSIEHVAIDPMNGSCVVFGNAVDLPGPQAVGRIAADGTVEGPAPLTHSFLGAGFSGGFDIAVHTDGRILMADKNNAGAIWEIDPTCPDSCPQVFVDLGPTSWRVPRHLAVDPIEGAVYLLVGDPIYPDEEPRLLRFDRSGRFTGSAPIGWTSAIDVR